MKIKDNIQDFIVWKDLLPTEQMGIDCGGIEEHQFLMNMLADARLYITSFNWCRAIKEEYFGLGIGKCFAVFFFKIEPMSSDVDEYLWVVVGDLPPLYLVTDNAPNPASALSEYTKIMERWAIAAQKNEYSEELPPVSAPFTIEYGKMLDSRINFIKEYLQDNYSVVF